MPYSPPPLSDVAQAKQKLYGLRLKYEGAKGTANIFKNNAEDTKTLSAEERAKFRRRYEQKQAEIKSIEAEIAKQERIVSQDERKTQVEELRKEVRTLQEEYNAKLDKRSTEAIELKKELDDKKNRLDVLAGAKQAQAGIDTAGTRFLEERGAVTPSEVKKTEVAAELPMGGATGGAGAGGAGGGVVTPTTPKKEKGPKKSEEQLYQEAYALAQDKYNMPDIIFNNVPSLGKILQDFVNGKIDANGFRVRVENDIWYRQNSSEIKNRYARIFNYEDLKNKGQAVGTSAFEQDLRGIKENIQEKAVQILGSRITDDEAVEKIAKELYLYNLDKSDLEIRQRIAKYVKPTVSRIAGVATEGFGGEAKANYDALYSTAKANGFKLEDVLPRLATGKPMDTTAILQDIASGKLDVNRIQQDIRRLAAVGQSDFVKEQLGQGFDLDVIYSPYKKKMASVLEITDPDTIDINDPALRMGITKDGDMNLFDYEKALRKDKRWQYTENAKEEIGAVLGTVLRDFGFRR